MAKTDTPASIAQIAASIKSIGQARAALGVVADVCRKAYVVAQGIDAITDDVRTSAISRVDTVNNYAQRVYNSLPDDGPSQTLAVPALVLAKVSLVLGQAQRAFADVEEASRETQWSFADLLVDGVSTAAGWVGEGVEAVVATTLKAAGGASLAFVRAAWPTILLVGLGLALYFEWKTGFIRKLIRR